MTHSKKILLTILFSLAAASAAQASDYTNSGSYNGAGATLNTASNFNLRDSNNNMTMVNGQFTSSNFSSLSGGGGVQSASAGVGTGGAGSMSGQAEAIGNSLNVVTVGSNNTVIVNSAQTNNGNQTASVDVNRH